MKMNVALCAVISLLGGGMQGFGADEFSMGDVYATCSFSYGDSLKYKVQTLISREQIQEQGGARETNYYVTTISETNAGNDGTSICSSKAKGKSSSKRVDLSYKLNQTKFKLYINLTDPGSSEFSYEDTDSSHSGKAVCKTDPKRISIKVSAQDSKVEEVSGSKSIGSGNTSSSAAKNAENSTTSVK